MDPTKFSRNYKMGSVEGNMIFEGNSYLPKEVMLEMTLKAFGYDIDMLEVNLLSSFILHWTPRFVSSSAVVTEHCDYDRLAWRARGSNQRWKPCLDRTASSPTPC